MQVKVCLYSSTSSGQVLYTKIESGGESRLSGVTRELWK